MENDKGPGVADGTFVRETGCGEMADCGTTTPEEQDRSWETPGNHKPHIKNHYFDIMQCEILNAAGDKGHWCNHFGKQFGIIY